mmetsp:Transcript_7952/g.21929  ORF Transcript_7952/g.21929 Transcript_7952/m.21929 type:complete len:136 (+) Transcript_7952:1577-1984(+)
MWSATASERYTALGAAFGFPLRPPGVVGGVSSTAKVLMLMIAKKRLTIWRFAGFCAHLAKCLWNKLLVWIMRESPRHSSDGGASPPSVAVSLLSVVCCVLDLRASQCVVCSCDGARCFRSSVHCDAAHVHCSAFV